ncbi:hypothetical protein B0H66DRAFT_587557 [Apodospora peruviana]|uniref:Uncharacterized protein n=1 Tax=Apodospora peruviana TaxID=516989 RepID=A0AAE0IUD7_9PEZI|nr:hypothetical protein B0H66DRAFT_587557 [Apodospora peruviana]
MRLHQALLALLPVVITLAAPSPALERQTRDVYIVHQVNRLTSDTAIEIWNQDGTEILGYSCSAELSSGAFQDSPITFDIDANRDGAGNLTIGAHTYAIHDDVNLSGGISCGRISSPGEIMIKCLVPLSGDLASAELAPLNKRDLASCFQKSFDLLQVMSSLEGGTEMTAASELQEFTAEHEVELGQDAIDIEGHNHTGTLAQRQGTRLCETSPRIHFTERVGNGNPHQNPRHVQLSEPMECPPNNGCEIGHSNARSYSVGWSAGISPFGWISGGFAVQETIETGNTHTCYGSPRDFFAIWKCQGQTAYTVRNAWRARPGCGTGSGISSSNFVIWSPNEQNRQGFYYCVYGRNYVRAIGDNWLDTTDAYPWGPLGP